MPKKLLFNTIYNYIEKKSEEQEFFLLITSVSIYNIWVFYMDHIKLLIGNMGNNRIFLFEFNVLVFN